MRVFLLTFFSILIASCAVNPSSPPKPDFQFDEVNARIAAERLARLEFFSFGQFDTYMEDAGDMMAMTMTAVIEKNLNRDLTNAEKEILKDISIDTLSENITNDEWVSAVGKVYQRLLTTQELQELLEFYNTSTGRRLLRLQTTIYKQAASAGKELVESRMDRLIAALQSKLKKEMPDLMAEIGEVEQQLTLGLSPSIQACQKIQNADELPIGCAFEYVEGRPAMMIALRNLEDVDEYWDSLTENMAGPFCSASNADKSNGFVIVSVVNLELGKLFNCSQNNWSDWIDLKDIGSNN